MFEEFSKAFASMTDGLICTAPAVSSQGEVAIDGRDNTSLLDDREEDETNLSQQELLQRFVTEACLLKDHATSAAAHDQVGNILKRWEKRLRKDRESKTEKNLKALLNGRSLDVLFLALTRSEAGRQVLKSAASIEPDDGQAGSKCLSHVPGAVALRNLLSMCSDAPEALVGCLLTLLAELAERDAIDTSRGQQGSQQRELQWALLLLSSVVLDPSEFLARKSSAKTKELDNYIAEVMHWAKVTSRPPPFCPVDAPLKQGSPVWAEYPSNGRWYRAAVGETDTASLDERIRVKWMERPKNVIGGQEDHYIAAVVDDFFDYSQPSAVSAVIPANQDRPVAVFEVEEEGWQRQLQWVEKLTELFHTLKQKYEQLGEPVPKKEEKRTAEAEKKWSTEAVKTVSASSETLEGLLEDGNRRAGSKQDSPMLQEVLSAAKDVKGFMQERLGAAQSLNGAQAALLGRRQEVADACLEAARLRRRQLEELNSGLHAAVFGADANFLVQEDGSGPAVRELLGAANKLADQAWKEAVQFAAETLDGPLAAGSADMSRAAKRYREMKPELKQSLERLGTLERNAPMLPASAAKRPKPKPKAEPPKFDPKAAAVAKNQISKNSSQSLDGKGQPALANSKDRAQARQVPEQDPGDKVSSKGAWTPQFNAEFPPVPASGALPPAPAPPPTGASAPPAPAAAPLSANPGAKAAATVQKETAAVPKATTSTQRESAAASKATASTVLVDKPAAAATAAATPAGSSSTIEPVKAEAVTATTDKNSAPVSEGATPAAGASSARETVKALTAEKTVATGASSTPMPAKETATASPPEKPPSGPAAKADLVALPPPKPRAPENGLSALLARFSTRCCGGGT